MPERRLAIRLYGKIVGLLTQNSAGEMRFQYREGANMLSVSLPIQEAAYGHSQCEAYFGGLLPESELARAAIGRRLGINANNTFSLLQAIGYDCAGAVSIHALEGVEISEAEANAEALELETDVLYSVDGKVLNEKELAQHIRELPQRPLFIDVEDLRLSLAGVQDKAAVCVVGQDILIPHSGSPTTHILKPAIATLHSTVENEYFCLQLARHMGFLVPSVEMRLADTVPFLLVERYDRQWVGERLKRLHQEDFCQALGRATVYKYEAEGGPGFGECFTLLRQTTQPALARNRLMEMVVFNYLIGNTDAHGKNFSLLHLPGGGLQLAPFYDILCTQAYPRLTKKMAMAIGGETQIGNIRLEHWERLSRAVGFTMPRIKAILRDQVEKLPAMAELERDRLKDNAAMAWVDIKILDKMRQVLEKRIFEVSKRLNL
jgi:serine/threonine-protein kinase HipA